MKKVKIYGTLGPSCSETEILIRMFEEGMDGVRLNLSHTSLEGSADIIEACSKAAQRCGICHEFMIDMQGPELRIGSMNESLRLRDDELIDASLIPFPEAVLVELQKYESGCGSHQDILLDDGRIMLRTEQNESCSGSRNVEDGCRQGNDGLRRLTLRVIRGGLLQSRKSIALPGRSIDTPAITDADLQNIRNAGKYGVTAVMQPFVRSKEDLITVRKALDEAGCSDIRIFAKIENLRGLEKLEELIPHCDEIVIARGDLGNSMDLWELPAAQKRIAAACRTAGRDFMVVTQMLDSMMHRQVPTRAEVSDIFNAVLDGAASVMVTGETAAGEYPDRVIRYLSRTVREAEQFCG